MIGIVYLARVTKEPQDFVCIKRMLGETLSEKNLFKALRSEIEILYKAKDIPGCIQLIDVLKDEESISLVFPYCSSGDLSVYRKKVSYTTRQLNEHLARSIFKQIAKTLQQLHNLRIIHRDIKPENILVELDDSDKYNSVKVFLSDFGFAMKLDVLH